MTRAWLLLVGALVVVGLVLALGLIPVEPFDEPTMEALSDTTATIEDRTPDPFTLTTPDGQTVSLASLSGHPVYLSFWAEWCDICKNEMPSLDAFARAHAGEVEVLVTTIDDNPTAALRWLQRNFPNGVGFRVLLDPGGRVAHSVFGTTGVPETFVIDPHGELVARYVGGYDFTDPAHARLASEIARP